MSGDISNWSLQRKLLAAFFAVGLVPLLVASGIVLKVANDALYASASNQLESLREAKRSEIQTYFTTIRDQVLTSAESSMTIAAMREFRRAFHETQAASNLTDGQKAKVKAYYDDQFGVEYKSQNGVPPDIGKLLPSSSLELYRQYRYIAGNEHPLGSKDALDHASLDGEEYDEVHRKYHPMFRSFLSKFGYYDIFLVDPETGHIVYSVFKELDLSLIHI